VKASALYDESLFAFRIRRLETAFQPKLIHKPKRQRFAIEEAVRPPIDRISFYAISADRASQATGAFPEFAFSRLASQSGGMRHGQTGDATPNNQGFEHVLSLSAREKKVNTALFDFLTAAFGYKYICDTDSNTDP
jgi:hypothetical protein